MKTFLKYIIKQFLVLEKCSYLYILNKKSYNFEIRYFDIAKLFESILSPKNHDLFN